MLACCLIHNKEESKSNHLVDELGLTCEQRMALFVQVTSGVVALAVRKLDSSERGKELKRERKGNKSDKFARESL